MIGYYAWLLLSTGNLYIVIVQPKVNTFFESIYFVFICCEENFGVKRCHSDKTAENHCPR